MLDQVMHQDEGVRALRWVLKGTLSKPLLLVGPCGVGKRFAVTQLTREMFCSGSKTDDCKCNDCVQLHHDVHPDLWQVAAGEKEIGIGESRDAIAATGSYPSQAPYRVFVLDGADRMTAPAANALLKLLEEPPPTTRFFLIAELPHLVIPTIRSRCGLVPFHSWPEESVLSKISQYEKDPTKALVYVRLGEGSVGEAVKLWGSGRLSLRDIVVSVLQSAKNRNYSQLFTSFEILAKDLPLSLHFLNLVLHDLIMLSYGIPRRVNLDIEETLSGLNYGVPVERWFDLRRQLQVVRDVYRKTKINLGFHMRSIIIDAFV